MRAVSTLFLFVLALGSATGAPTGDLATAFRAGVGATAGNPAEAVPGNAPLFVRAPLAAPASAVSREHHQQQERDHVVQRDSGSLKVVARAATTTSSCRRDYYKALNGTCIKCITVDPHAMTCNSTTPFTCSDGLVPEGYKCVESTAERAADGTTDSSTVQTTVTCRKDHYASSSGTCIKCVTIDSHALTCTSAAPLTCSDGYVVSGRGCVVPTERITTAESAEPTSTSACRKDMYKAADGSCIKCTTVDSRALTCTSKTVLTCTSGYGVKDGRCVDARLLTTSKRTTTTSTIRSTTKSTTPVDRRTTPVTTTIKSTTTRSTTTNLTTTKSTTKSTTPIRTTTTSSTSTGLNANPQATTTTTTSSPSPTTTSRVTTTSTPSTTSTISASTTTSTTKSTTSPPYYTRTAAGVATVVATGVGPGASQIVSGNAGGGLSWQASGFLARNGCPVNVEINNCWTMVLQSTANLAPARKRGLVAQEEFTEIEERYEEVGAFEPFYEPEPTFYEADDRPLWAGGAVDVNAQNLFRRANPREVPNPKDFVSWPGEGEGDGDGDGGDGDTSPTPSPTTSPEPPTTSTTTISTTTISTTTISTASTSTKTTTSTPTPFITTTQTQPSTTTTSSTTTTTPKPTPTPRQRIEMYSIAAAADTTWQYKWRSFVSTRTTTTRTFFHLWQLLRRDATGGAVITLDGKNGSAVLFDPIRGCGNSCGSIPWSEFTGRTIQHSLQVTFGNSGTLFYVMSDGVTDEVLLTYSATGQMGAQTSVKFGLYRAYVSGISIAEAWVGDFSMTQIFG